MAMTAEQVMVLAKNAPTWLTAIAVATVAYGVSTGKVQPQVYEPPTTEAQRQAEQDARTAEAEAERLRWQNLTNQLAGIQKSIEEGRGDIREVRTALNSLDHRVDSLESAGMVNSEFRQRTDKELERLRAKTETP